MTIFFFQGNCSTCKVYATWKLMKLHNKFLRTTFAAHISVQK